MTTVTKCALVSVFAHFENILPLGAPLSRMRFAHFEKYVGARRMRYGHLANLRSFNILVLPLPPAASFSQRSLSKLSAHYQTLLSVMKKIL